MTPVPGRAGGTAPSVAWIALDDVRSPVLGSQVVAPLRVYAEHLPEVEFRLVFVDAARRALSRGSRRALDGWRDLWPGGDIRLIPYVGRFGDAVMRAVAGSALPRRGAPLVFHCRAPYAVNRLGDLARRRGARLILDARGASDLEAPLIKGAAGQPVPAATVERAVAGGLRQDVSAWRAADAVSAVSGRLLDHLERSGGPREMPKEVIPPSVETVGRDEEARTAIRARLGLRPEDLVLAHVSTSPQWEDYEGVIRLFRAVTVTTDAHLHLLTTVPASRVLASLPPEDPLRRRVLVEAVPPGGMHRRLSAADAGLLVRRTHPALAVTVPAKFPEYLAAGLPVAVSAGCGEVEDLAASSGAGIVLRGDAGADAAALLRLLEGRREGASPAALRLCRERFTWVSHLPRLRRLYGMEKDA